MDGFSVVRVAKGKHTRAESLEIGQRFVEAILGDEGSITDIALASHVPLAEVSCGVSVIMQAPGQHGGLGIQPLGNATIVVELPAREVGIDPPALWILTRGDRDA